MNSNWKRQIWNEHWEGILYCEGGQTLAQAAQRSWKCSQSGWVQLWGTCSSGRGPCPRQGLGTRWSLSPLPTQTILWWDKMREKDPSDELHTQGNCDSLVHYSELLNLMLVFFREQQKICRLSRSWLKVSWLLSKGKQTNKELWKTEFY